MKIIIYGKPIPKARHISHVIRGKMSAYDPQGVEKSITRKYFIKKMAELMDGSYNIFDRECSYSMKIDFYMPIGVSHQKNERNTRMWGVVQHTQKPDLSNMLKFYEDCANEVLYHDDSQLVSISMNKYFSDKPRTEIEIMSEKKTKLSEQSENLIKAFSPTELKDFFNDIKEISKMDKKDDEFHIKNVGEEWIESAAILLSVFANKYQKKLKKLSS